MAFRVPRLTIWGNRFFEHFVFCFSHLRTLIKKALDGFAINSIGFSKLHFSCPAKHFEGKMPFLKQKLKIFFISKPQLSEKVWTFFEKKSDSVVKMQLYLSRGHFVELLLQISYFSFRFRHWTKSFCTFDGNFLSGVVKLHSTCPGFFRISSSKHCFFSIVSGFWLKTVRTFIEKFPVVSLERHSLCPEQKFEENSFLKELFIFYHFRTFIEKQFGWFAKSSRELSKLHFRCPEELWRDWVFFAYLHSIPCLSDFDKKKLELLLEGFRPRCQNCVPCVQKDVLTNKFSKPRFVPSF